jgi:cytoskeleton protein RodZ
MSIDAPLQAQLAIDSVGRQLQSARAVKGLTIEEAARQLHCDVSLLAALEEDRSSDIGAVVFVRGHLRRYAEFLGANVEELCAQWASGPGAAASLPDLARAPQAPRVIDSAKWTRRGVLAFAVLALLIALWLVLQSGSGA